jgi:hypothetical protein
MTEIEPKRVSILDPVTGQRKPFLVEPTRGDNKRAKITLSREDRDARGKEQFKE